MSEGSAQFVKSILGVLLTVAAVGDTGCSKQPGASSRFRAVGVLVIHGEERAESRGQDVAATAAELRKLQESGANAFRQPSLLVDALADAETGPMLRKTAWFHSFDSTADALAAMQKDVSEKLVVTPGPDLRTLRLQFSADAAQDAVEVLTALGNAYMKCVAQAQQSADVARLTTNTQKSQLLLKELEQDVEPNISAMERDLGKDNVEIYSAWNGKRMQVDALLQEKARISRELAASQAQLQKVKDPALHGQEGALHALQNQVIALQAEASAIDAKIKAAGSELGVLNQKMTEYQQLKEKEKRLRDQIQALQSEADRMKNLRMGVQWKQVEWLTQPRVAEEVH